MNDVVIVRDATKTYRTGVGRARVREMIPPPFDSAVSRMFPKWWLRNTFNALQDVSLSIEPGTSTGLVGHNGAGKTTLLKVIAGVVVPNWGSVEVTGRVGALIDALVGFHPELTGRENIFLLGTIHGIGRKKMAERVDWILDFAEIDEMADTPVKRFSAGMTSRLGFATIISFDPDLLLIDEVLSVGDARFQHKCIQWMDGYMDRGGTLLFVSHNLALLRSMTERTVWLDHGRLVGDGSTADVLNDYARALERRDTGAPMRGKKKLHRSKIHSQMVAHGLSRWGAGGARVEEVHFEQLDDGGSGIDVEITYENDDVEDAVFCIGFVDDGDREIGSAASPPVTLKSDSGAVKCEIRPLPLRPGIYFPIVAILSRDGLVRDRWRLDRAVVVEQNGQVFLDEFGPVAIPSEWS
jgi:ABC-type polysaccharide/polyol phosphate transport system ATPase subunit